MRLPAEIRVQIYEEVFEGALITVVVNWKDGDMHKVRYKFSSECGLAITCRAIKADSADHMWRAAVVHAVAKNGRCPVPIRRLVQALPSDIARQVQFLSNVTFYDHLKSIDLEGTGQYSLQPSPNSIQDITTSLLKFPKLKVCLAVLVSDRYVVYWDMTEMGMTFDGMFFGDYVGSLPAVNDCNQKLVPFEARSWPSPGLRELLKYFDSIQAASSIKILSRQKIRYRMLVWPRDDDHHDSAIGYSKLKQVIAVCFCSLDHVWRGDLVLQRYTLV